MVGILKLFLWMGCVFTTLYNIHAIDNTNDSDVVIEASIDLKTNLINKPIRGIISITYPSQQKIDVNSFEMNAKPLDVSLIRSVRLSSSNELMIAIYSFDLPPQNPGLYLLPAITVKIGGVTYHTVPSSYQIIGPNAITPYMARSGKNRSETYSSLVFRLEASIDGPRILYIGERSKFLYQISYNRNIDLTRSFLPMINPINFQKVGDVQIKDYQDLDITKQDLEQEIQASEIGIFDFGPSVIEGYAYSMDASGNKHYEEDLLHAEAPLLQIEVKPFPVLNQPPSFTGALGRINAITNMHSSSNVKVGDEILLIINIAGITNLENLELPPIQCQPGISGFFQISDLPSLAKIDHGTKKFMLELRVLSSLVKEIPPLELSSFDPATATYIVQILPSFPLHIYQPNKQIVETLHQNEQILPEIFTDWPIPSLAPLIMYSNPITIATLQHSWLHSASVLWSIPIWIGLIFLQKQFFRYRQKQQHDVSESTRFLQKALKATESNEMLTLLEQACWLRLWEDGLLPKNSYELTHVIKQNQASDLTSFLMHLQMLHYGAVQKTFDMQLLKAQARHLKFF